MTEHNDREAEKQYLITILEESADFIGSADMEGKLLYHNRAARRMVGLPDNTDLSTMTIVDLHPEWVMQLIYETAIPTILTHGTWRGETAILHRDGREIPVFQTLVLHRDANGRPEFMSSMMHELTERKQKEEQLKLLNYAFNYVDEAIFLTDENAQFVQVNEKACRSLGYSREELLEMRIFDIDPDYTLQRWQQRRVDIAEGNLSAIIETRHQAKDGRIFLIEVSANYIAYQGRHYDMALVRDITERNERKQVQKALHRSQSLLTEAQRIAHIGSWEVDFVSGILSWSDETFRIWEINQAQFGATFEAFLETVHPEDRDKVAHTYNASVTHKTLYQIEHRLLFSGGRVKYIAERGEPFCDENGNVIRFVGTAMDITERHHIEETLKFVAQRGWKGCNESFLVALTQYLAQLFQVDYVIIDKVGTPPTQAETVALYVKGAIAPNMQYDLKNTPCADVMNGKLCCYPEGVQQLFPEDSLLVEMQIESYAGLPLWNTAGNVIGLIAVLDSKPLKDTAFISSILQLVATSVAAELERQHSEQALLDSRHFLEQIINTIADPVFVKDRQHRWILLNQAFCEYIGYPLEHLLSKSDYDIHLPQEADVFWEKDELVFSTGVENINEETATNADGICRTILTKKRCFTDSTGQLFLVGIITDITERKKIEKILRQREQEFRVLVETSPAPIIRYDAHCRRTYVNPAVEKMAGKTAAQMLDHAPSDGTLLNEHIKNEIEQILQFVLKTGQISESEVELILADGQTHYFYNRYAPELDANGKAVGVVLVGHDITARKQVEQLLAQREQEFRTLAENMPANLSRYDVQGRLTYMTPSLITSLAPEVSPIIGKTLIERFPDDDIARTGYETIMRVIATGEEVELEVVLPNPYGEMRTHQIRHVAERDQHGKIIGVIAIGLDITERKRMRDELAAREREFRILVETSPAPIFRYDTNCRRIYVNPVVEQVIGKTAAELLNRVPSDASVLSKSEGEKLESVLRQVIQTGQATEGEIECVIASGETRYYDNRYAPELDANGNVLSVILVALDITERKHAEQLLAQREQEFRTLVDNLPTTVLRYNRHLQRIYANPVYLQIMGGSEAELLNKPLEETWIATNVSAASYKAILTKVMRDGEKAEVLLEWTNRKGELISHVLKIVPEYALDGQIQSALVLGFDFSEQRKQQIIETNRHQVFEKMARNNSLDAILEQVALYVESAKAGCYCAILLTDDAKNRLQLVAAPSFPQFYCAKSSALTLEINCQHCLGWATAALSKERVIIDNLHEHPCALLCQDCIQEINAVVCWSEPIISSYNQPLGMVALYLNSACQPDENDLALLQKAAHLSAIAIERKRIEQQMQHQASYDALTGLPNRRIFHDRLQEEISKAERKGHQLAVLFIDLDHFKNVNDTLGHEIGDNLLIHAAQRIQSCVRQSDTVARLGGDEFVVILPELGNVPPVERIAEAIIRAMTQPFKLGEYHTYVSASVGIAMYPQDAHHAETLVSYADQAMYAAKEAGRNSFNFFTRSMQEHAQQRLYLVNSLRDALEKNQLEVYYQPIIEVSTGKAVKAEALLRWHHPVLGMVSPAVFIPLAEETDLIQEIGRWVFCQAADMTKHWNMLSGENELRKVSINMSPRQLIKGSGDQIVIDYLRAIALDSIHIVVEITEGLLLDDSPHITEKLERLRNTGIQLSLDDFGTGYSAMAYLKKFDINYLKIDRSFVRELETNANDQAITEAIVMMAHRLGLKVIAEGVETEGQQSLLAAVGCDYIQGYFHAKPMPKAVFLSYVLA